MPPLDRADSDKAQHNELSQLSRYTAFDFVRSVLGRTGGGQMIPVCALPLRGHLHCTYTALTLHSHCTCTAPALLAAVVWDANTIRKNGTNCHLNSILTWYQYHLLCHSHNLNDVLEVHSYWMTMSKIVSSVERLNPALFKIDIY